MTVKNEHRCPVCGNKFITQPWEDEEEPAFPKMDKEIEAEKELQKALGRLRKGAEE